MTETTYTTIQGDMWDAIAHRIWGEERLMHHLMAANPKRHETVVFEAGVVLTVPVLPDGSQTQEVRAPWR